MSKTVILVGCGTAAMGAAVALRNNGYDGRLIAFCADGARPYSPVATSYFAGGRIAEEDCLTWSTDQLERLDLEVRDREPVTKLDPRAKTVATGKGSYSYDACLIASGSSPVMTGFPPVNDYEPLTLGTLEAAKRLKEVLESSTSGRILISGTSMIAMKALEACLEQDWQVTLLGRSAHTMRRVALEQAAGLFEQGLVEKGVQLKLGCAIKHATMERDGLHIAFSDGATERFDQALVAHGMKPNLGFLDPDYVDRGKGLAVDGFLRTAYDGLFAAGDVARVTNRCSGEKETAGQWIAASQQGRCAGVAMAALLMEDQCSGLGYEGFFPTNTVSVGDLALVSGGLVATSAGAHVQRTALDECDVFKVFDTAGSLIGFNVVSQKGHPGSRMYDEADQLMRQIRSSIQS